jgi:hypothetical protein
VSTALDESLLLPRRVKRSMPDDAGIGYMLELSCGHTIWVAASRLQGAKVLCGGCLNALVIQIRELQAEQKI